MIKQLSIKNFKCFDELNLDLAPMTVLTGLNNMGKSSILQSLLLLRQSYHSSDKLYRNIRLKGTLVELGGAADVFCESGSDDLMSFTLTTIQEGIITLYTLRGTFDVATQTFKDCYFSDMSNATSVSLFNDNFHYICADRWGPKVVVPLSEYDVIHRNLGKYGEYIIHYLLTHGEERFGDPRSFLNPDMPLLKESGKSLLQQTQAWLGEISPGTRIEPIAHRDIDVATLSFSFPYEYGYSKYYRSTHVGFGLSCVLPIIVALLSLPTNGLVLLENPEAHLHPGGQSLMGKLMAQVAAAGTQVIVETHSDHLLDGIRIAVRDSLLKPQQTAFHYFSRNEKKKIKVTTPQIDTEGRLDQWPEGFFDEAVKNLAALSSRRR
jgi:predicted ATPase